MPTVSNSATNQCFEDFVMRSNCLINMMDNILLNVVNFHKLEWAIFLLGYTKIRPKWSMFYIFSDALFEFIWNVKGGILVIFVGFTQL